MTSRTDCRDCGHADAGRDGRAHLTVYLDGNSFVWSGNVSDPIEVSPGGYGEQVAYRVPVGADRFMFGYLTGEDGHPVRAFQAMCEDWLDDDDTLTGRPMCGHRACILADACTLTADPEGE